MSLRRATLLSIALHCCAIALIVALPRSADAPDRTPNESVSTYRISILKRVPVVRPLPLRVRTPSPATTAIAVAPHAEHRSTQTVVARAIVPRRADATVRIVPALIQPSQASHVANGAQTHATIAARTSTAPATIAIPLASPTPTPAPTAAPTQAIVADTNVPPGGWGSFAKPLVADDDALASIRSSVHTTAVATIDVDETGHATRVVLPASLSGDLRAEIEKRLLAMQYVAAECNGLRCNGTLQVTI